MDGVLKSWALPKGIPERAGERRLAMKTEDHPVAYRDFEGTIPAGNYGAGRVILWDTGTYEVISGSPQSGKLHLLLNGKRTHGQFTLVRTRMQGEKDAWLMLKSEPKLPRGASSLPERIIPMEAAQAEAPFSDPEWVFERKWDGVRAIGRIERQSRAPSIRLWGRSLKDLGEFYPELIEGLSALLESNPAIDSLIFDGEIVARDPKGAVSFQALQRRMHLAGAQEAKIARRTVPVELHIFDLLFINGSSLLESPFAYRREILSLIRFPEPSPPQGPIRTSPLFTDGPALFSEVRREQGEGIVAKRKEGRYYPGKRTREWLKIKAVAELDCVVTGWTEGKGKRSGLPGALLLGLYDGPGLRYIGHTGSGFSEKTLLRAHELLGPIETGICPFAPCPPTNARPHWVRPVLVARVKFLNWTVERHLRAPVFLGFRDDVPMKSCRFENPIKAEELMEKSIGSSERIWIGERSLVQFEGNRMELSHLDKILWPERGYTKTHLIDYYRRVASRVIPHLKERPLTVIRFPNGIHEEGFYQKNWKDELPIWATSQMIVMSKETLRMIICNNASTLMWLSNLASIELHPWTSRAGKTLDFADFIIFDIDPPKERDRAVAYERFEQAVQVSLWMKKILEEQGTKSFVKTSGKSGLHVFVPIPARYPYSKTRTFAKELAERLEAEHPDQVTTAWKKEKRGRRVLVDFHQNARGKTMASIYSLRATEAATVSTPVTWEELPKVSPVDFTIETLPPRLDQVGDLWQEILNCRQDPLGRRNYPEK